MRKENLKLFAVLGLALVLRLVNLNQSFWLDEAAQVIESSRPFWGQFDLAADFHPPLYHLLLHFWLYVGKSEIWVRLLSIGFGISSVIILYQLGKLVVNKKTALIAALFLAISPYHIWYSQEARPYIAFLFFSLLSTFFLLQKKWVWYSLTLIFSLYTHYFTLFLLASHIAYIIFFEKRYFRKFIVSCIITLVSFTIWLPQFLKQLAIGTGGFFKGWTDVVSVVPIKTTVLTFFKFIFGRGTIEENFLYAAIIFPVFLLFVVSVVKIWRSKSGKILITLFFVPMVISETVSFFIPINAPQRLIFLLPLFYLMVAMGIYNLSRKIQLTAILIVAITSLGGIYQYYTDPQVQREQWREAVAFTEERTDEESVALFVFPGPFAPFVWYSKNKIDAWGIAPKFAVTDDDLKVTLPRLQTKNRIYFYQYLTGLTDPQEKTRNFLSTYGFRESDIKNFAGVGFIYIYEK